MCGLEGDTVILNDIFLYQVEGETQGGGLVGRYKINRSRPSFYQRLAYFGLDRVWAAALDEAETSTRSCRNCCLARYAWRVRRRWASARS